MLDAVSNGTVEMGHTASLYWQGRMPAAGFFTSVPFGLGPIEHQAWIELRDGQALWDELYKPYGVRAFLAGNTGPSMGGWFRRKLNGVEDLRGMRLRVQGLGAEVYAKLGAVPMTVSAGDLLPALEKGSIDAAEFLAPATDLDTGLPKYAPFYYAPGFNKPNGASELLISLRSWETLSPDLRSVVTEACRAEHALGLADAHQTNAAALTEILGKYPVTLEAFPRSVMEAAQRLRRSFSPRLQPVLLSRIELSGVTGAPWRICGAGRLSQPTWREPTRAHPRRHRDEERQWRPDQRPVQGQLRVTH
ncbi:TRAP transporter substrate-binding protein [Microvirga aerilata]|uniref:TRAP transporter substrate-binding protein n=1 Tax=Microvirga aerilata TaxID=670292 RepID=UPI00363E4EE9